MGAWGVGISSNDTAGDLREEYEVAFYYNDVETALKKIEAMVRKDVYKRQIRKGTGTCPPSRMRRGGASGTAMTPQEN